MNDLLTFPKATEQPFFCAPARTEQTQLPAQEFKLALSGGQFAYIKVPHDLKQADWEKLEGLLKVLAPCQQVPEVALWAREFKLDDL